MVALTISIVKADVAHADCLLEDALCPAGAECWQEVAREVVNVSAGVVSGRVDESAVECSGQTRCCRTRAGSPQSTPWRIVIEELMEEADAEVLETLRKLSEVWCSLL